MVIGIEAASVMFTIEQINDLHARLGCAKTLAEYVRALGAHLVNSVENTTRNKKGHGAPGSRPSLDLWTLTWVW